MTAANVYWRMRTSIGTPFVLAISQPKSTRPAGVRQWLSTQIMTSKLSLSSHRS